VSVAESEMNELRERMGLLVTKAYFVVRHTNKDLSVPECEQKALDLIQQVIKEVT
jgi:hypothetical protein